MFEKDLKVGRLLDFYGEILSDRKRDVMELYYNDDLSLAEIAEDIGISRQGVRELIKKADSELLFYEEKLGLAGRFESARLHAENALSLAKDSGVGNALQSEITQLMELVSSR